MAAQQNPIQMPAACAINLPIAPQNPPTDEDYYNAVQYIENVRVARGHGLVNSTNLREAQTYANEIHARITQGAHAAAPPWAIQMFAQVNARLDQLDQTLLGVDQTLQGVDQTLQGADQTLQGLDQRLARNENIAAKSHNVMAADGHTIAFVQVGFPNGNLPSQQPGDLPILSNIAVINTMTGPQCSTYCHLYYPGIAVPNSIIGQRRKICQAIGCLREPV